MLTPPMKDSEYALRQRLGSALRDARLAKAMTQGQLAEAVETDPETISRFERGATLPSLARLLVLAEALDVTVASLLGSASSRPADEWEALRTAMLRLKGGDRALALTIVQAIAAAREAKH
ncbi:MAG: helix-turn-helix transcriptional regulator [Rubrivivax sp.]